MFSYQHHIGDFRRDTASLSDTDAMAYLKLLWMYYDTESPLPADAKLLAFKIGSNADTVQLLLDAFFVLDGDVYRQKRCDAEIEAYHGRSTIARNKANKRWKNAVASKTDATAMPQHSNSTAVEHKNHANREPITENRIDITPKPPRGAISLEQYLDQCRNDSKKPIPEDHPVFDYAREIGLPHDFLRLQWLEFKDRYTAPGAKKYKLWSTVFAKSVRDNWFRLWMLKDDQYVLTTTGLQAQKLHKVAA